MPTNTTCYGGAFSAARHRGLSPRVRGSHEAWQDLTTKRVYPRVCGGAPDPMRLHDSSHGRVYPRVCGGAAPRRAANLRNTARVYPRVCGGASCFLDQGTGPAWVYPRVCGGAQTLLRVLGDARVYPRVCGGAPNQSRETWSHRVYPRVCGGAVSVSLIAIVILPGVYPRVCGGAGSVGHPPRCAGARPCVPRGLSPRVRGSLCQIFDKGAALFSI